MAEGMAEQINGFARNIFKKITEGAKAYNSHEFNQLYLILSNWSKSNAKYLVNNFNIDSDICSSAFHDAIMYALNSYDGERDFLPLYKVVFRNKLIDELRKENITIETLSLNSEIYDDDSNVQGERIDIIDDKINIAEIEESYSSLESFYKLFAAVCIEEKKSYSRKKCLCYTPLFFTDKLVFQIFDGQTEMRFNGIVKHNSNKFDEAAVFEFLNTLVTGMCYSVTDIKKYKCKPLSGFTEKQEDIDKPCCTDDPNYHVFNSFLKKYYKDDGISQSDFSQHKKKLAKILMSIKNELQYD